MVLDIGSIIVNDLNEIDISIEIKRSCLLVFFREQKTIKTLKTLKWWVLSVVKYINWNNWKCCGIFSYWSLLQHIYVVYTLPLRTIALSSISHVMFMREDDSLPTCQMHEWFIETIQCWVERERTKGMNDNTRQTMTLTTIGLIQQYSGKDHTALGNSEDVCNSTAGHRRLVKTVGHRRVTAPVCICSCNL